MAEFDDVIIHENIYDLIKAETGAEGHDFRSINEINVESLYHSKSTDTCCNRQTFVSVAN